MPHSDAGSHVAVRGSVTATERQLAPDLARGSMLLLIALAYAPTYLVGLEPGAYINPAGGGPLDQVVNFAKLVLLDSRAYPMFAALFGYGMAMLIARQLQAGTPEPDVRRLLRRRALFLLLFGFVHGALVYPGEILGPYGVASLLLGWLLFRREGALLRAAAILAPLFVVTTTLMAVGMSAPVEQGEFDVLAIPDSYAMAVLYNATGYPFAMMMTLLGFPMLVALLLGAWAGRRKVLENPERHRTTLARTAWVGITISVLAGLPVALVDAQIWQPGWPASGLLLAAQILTGVLGGLGYAALFGLLSIRLSRAPGPVTRALAAMGKRSLTFYLLHSALLAVLLSPALFGLGAHLHSFGAALVAVGVWLMGLATAVALERARVRGPADALLRRLVYRRSHSQS